MPKEKNQKAIKNKKERKKSPLIVQNLEKKIIH